MQIYIFSLSKTKDRHILDLEKKYTKRLNKLQLSIIENVPLGNKAKTISYFKDFEKKHNIKYYILKESGQNIDTISLCEKLENETCRIGNKIGFIIGQADGVPKYLESFGKQLSLSPLTFPHQLARLILIEQIYRLQCFINEHPYHKA